MQRIIDAARSGIFNSFLKHSPTVNPLGRSGTFSRKFDEAWRRSLLPNSELPDGEEIERGLR